MSTPRRTATRSRPRVAASAQSTRPSSPTPEPGSRCRCAICSTAPTLRTGGASGAAAPRARSSPGSSPSAIPPRAPMRSPSGGSRSWSGFTPAPSGSEAPAPPEPGSYVEVGVKIEKADPQTGVPAPGLGRRIAALHAGCRPAPAPADRAPRPPLAELAGGQGPLRLQRLRGNRHRLSGDREAGPLSR